MGIRELTLDKHTEAERTPMSVKMVTGTVTKDEYTDYLIQMLSIYGTLETVARSHGLLDEFPGLERAHLIYKDFAELANFSNAQKFTLRESTKEYTQYLMRLHTDKDKVLAHLYVRHMGDLFGGQVLAKRVPGSGNFYKFEDRQSLISKFRSMITEAHASEANKAFDFTIKILNEYV